MSGRNWCFTLNNYSAEEHEAVKALVCRYIVVGEEEGEEGTKHLQGYIELEKVCRLSACKKLIKRAHWETRKGTPAQASDYCKKDGKFYEKGNLQGDQGKRTDIERVKEAVEEGGIRGVIARGTNFNFQSVRIAEKFLEYHEKPRRWKPTVTWLWGSTGTGKSFTARQLLVIEEDDEDDLYEKNDGSKWWTSYDGHSKVIIDDFRDSWWGITEMLSLLDRYGKRVEYKGGVRQFLAKEIVVTCNKHPKDCYAGTGEAIDQLLRRIDTVKEVKICNIGVVTEVGGNTGPDDKGKEQELDFLYD